MAVEGAEIKAVITIESGDAKKKVAEAEAVIEKFKKESEKNARIKLELDVAQLQSKLVVARKELAEYSKQLRETNGVAGNAGFLQAQTNVNSISKELSLARAKVREFDSAIQATSPALMRLSRLAKDFISIFILFKVQDFFKAITVGAFNAARDFDTAFQGVIKTVGGTQEQLSTIEKQFRDLASGPKAIPIPIEELLRIGELGGQLGVAREELAAFSEVIARFAVSTNVSADEAATSFARIAEVTRLPQSQMENFASAVVNLGNNFAANEQEILDFTTRISGAGAVVGITASELAGIATAFTSVGVEAEAGGTAVQKVLLKFNEVVSSGGEELEKFAKISQVSQEEFVRLYESKPIEVFQRFIKGLQISGQDASAVLGELVGEDVRLQRAFLSVASAGDLLNRTLDSQANAFSKNTALATESDKKFESIASRVQVVKNQFNNVAIEIGRVFAATILPVGEFFAKLSSDIVLSTNKLGLFSAVLKGLGAGLTVLLLGKGLTTTSAAIDVLVKSISAGVAPATAAANAFKGLSGALVFLRTSIASLLGQVGILAIAVTTLVTVYSQQQQAIKEVTLANEGLRRSMAEIGSLNPGGNIEKYTKSIGELVATAADAKLVMSQFSLGGFDTTAFYSMSLAASESAASVERLGDSLGLSRGTLENLVPELDKLRKGSSLNSEEQISFAENIKKVVSAGNAQIDSVTKLSQTLKGPGVDGVKAFSLAFGNFGKTLTKNVDVEGFQKNTIEKMIRGAKDAGNIGEAYAIAISAGFTDSGVRSLLSDAGIVVSKEITDVLLAKAVNAGDAGEAYGLLLLQGIKSTEVQNAKSAAELRDAVLNALTDAQATQNAAFAAFGNTGAIVQALINGILSKIPSLQGAVNSAISLISKLSLVDKAGFFGGVISKVSAFTGGIKANLDATINAVKAFDGATAPKAGGGGGGGGKAGKSEAEKEIEKAQKEEKQRLKKFEESIESAQNRLAKRVAEVHSERAKSAIKAYQDQLEETTKKIQELTKRTEEFFDGVKESIEEAKQTQIDLRREFDASQKEDASGFLESLGGRSVELQTELEAAKKKLEELQSQSGEGDKDNSEAIREAQNEITKLQDEQSSIQEIQNSLTEDQKKGLQEIIDLETKRNTLNQSQLLAFDFKKKQEEDKLAFEEAQKQQQSFIEAQEKLLAVTKGPSEIRDAVFGQLKDIGQLDFLTQESEILQKLNDIGFDGLTGEQAQELLKEFNTAAALQVEKESILAQQQELLNIKIDFAKQFEDAYFDSVQRQKDETQQLIDLVNEAILAQQRLVSAQQQSAVGQAAVESSVSNVINNNLTVSNSIDAEKIIRDTVERAF